MGAPSQALQIIFEMQSQRTSQKRAVKKIQQRDNSFFEEHPSLRGITKF
jgi:hypothetical protein